MAETSIRPRKPWAAGLLSLWQPGIGQLYSGHWKRALALWLAGLLGLFALVAAGLPKTFPGLVAWLALAALYVLFLVWDAVRLARRAPADYRLRRFNRWYVYLILGFAALFAADRLVAYSPLRSFYVPAHSMEPTIRPGDSLVVDVTRWWKGRQPSRGDLVVFASPENPSILVIKRVLAVGGERIEIRDNVVFIDGKPLVRDWGHARAAEDNRSPEELGANLDPVEVPPGTFFALGDDRGNSWDSRFHGPVPNTSLRGQPLYIYGSKDRSRIGSRLE
jgi:signal peptidase I